MTGRVTCQTEPLMVASLMHPIGKISLMHVFVKNHSDYAQSVSSKGDFNIAWEDGEKIYPFIQGVSH